LELVNEIIFNKFVRPICIPDITSKVANSTSGTVVGYGKTEARTTSNISRKLEIPIYDFLNCTKHSSDHKNMVSSRAFCGGSADGRGVCDGDSGSGVYVKYRGRVYLRGIVSAGLVNAILECDLEQVAVFTDVPHFYGWIKSGGSDPYAPNKV
jgi:secreted trypsin-like serine protease